MENNKRIIEINGVKMEIDLRNATVIDNFKVGDTIKVLVKGYNDYKSHVGMIVGFDEFQKLPTIVIAYLDIEYSGANIKFVYYNSESNKDWIEITKKEAISKLQDHLDGKTSTSNKSKIRNNE